MSVRQVYGEPTGVIWARVPQSVRTALDNRRRREQRTISGQVAIILKDWLQERGELPLPEETRESVAAGQ